MKTTIKTLALLLIISCTTTKLTEQQKLKQLFATELTAYGNDFNNENWSGVADRMYAKVFDFMPKEKMIEMFEGMKKSGMEMKFGAIKLDKISEVIVHENEKFCKVDYLGKLTMKLSGEMLDMKEMLSTNFKTAFGQENVTFDDKTNKIHINSTKSMLAISPKDENNWKFIEFNKAKTRMLKKLVSEEVLRKIIPEINLEDNDIFESEEVEEIETYGEMEEEEPEPVVPIFTVVENPPKLPGGEEKLYQYLGSKISYPQEAKDNGVSGRVFVQFVVEKNGAVSNIKVLRGIGNGCDKEAIRVVRAMPNWIPGTQRGEKVRFRYNLPINFKIGKVNKK